MSEFEAGQCMFPFYASAVIGHGTHSHQNQQNMQLLLKKSCLVFHVMCTVFFQPRLTQPLKSVSMCDDNVFELAKLDPQRRSYYAPFRLIKHYGKYIFISVYSANVF